jgi:hypothetical protein
MEGQVTLGRGIAAVGIVLAFIAIWVRALSFPVGQRYWDDGTLGGSLLILAVLAALALAAAVSTGDRQYDIAVGAIGGVGWGIYLFLPAVYAFDQWDNIDVGGWLGLCSALTFIGAAIATWASDRPVARPSAGGMLLAVAGLALVVAGLFPNFHTGQGTYWNIHGAGHSFGILLVILVVLELLSIAGAYSMSAGTDGAVLIGAVILGSTLAVPIGDAFKNFGHLEAGGWLAAVGGIVVAVGVALMWQTSAEETPAPATFRPAA